MLTFRKNQLSPCFCCGAEIVFAKNFKKHKKHTQKKDQLKQKLLSASANAVKLCLSTLPPNTSFETMHNLAQRATPTQMTNYKHALQLFKLYNSTNMSDDWMSLNIQQNFNGRNENVQLIRISNYKVGNNFMVNRLTILNNKINYSWLNESFNAFKIKCKQLFLTMN